MKFRRRCLPKNYVRVFVMRAMVLLALRLRDLFMLVCWRGLLKRTWLHTFSCIARVHTMVPALGRCGIFSVSVCCCAVRCTVIRCRCGCMRSILASTTSTTATVCGCHSTNLSCEFRYCCDDGCVRIVHCGRLSSNCANRALLFHLLNAVGHFCQICKAGGLLCTR